MSTQKHVDMMMGQIVAVPVLVYTYARIPTFLGEPALGDLASVPLASLAETREKSKDEACEERCWQQTD